MNSNLDEQTVITSGVFEGASTMNLYQEQLIEMVTYPKIYIPKIISLTKGNEQQAHLNRINRSIIPCLWKFLRRSPSPHDS